MMSTPADSSSFASWLRISTLVVAVGESVDHGHRARKCPLDRLVGLLAKERGVVDEHGFVTAHRSDDGGNAGVVSIADPHSFALLEVDAAEVLDEGRHEVLASLLTIADDVDATPELLVDCGAERILFALDQRIALQFPG
jgi:hypothetical protein